MGLAGGYLGVTGDEGRHHPSCGFKAQTQRRNVDEHHRVEYRALRGDSFEDGTLHGSPIRYGFVRVDAFVGFLAVEELLDELLHLRDPRRSSHKNHFVHRALVDPRVTEYLLYGFQGGSEQVRVEFLESRP